MIINENNNIVLSKNKKILKTDLSKFIGLMFHFKPETLVFCFDKKNIITIHMFFVFFNIDVIFLDENKSVIDLKESFKPFQIYTTNKRIRYFIELKEGTIKKGKVKLGNKISF